MTVELRGRKTERSDGDPQVPDPGNAGGGKSPRGSLSCLRLTLLGVGAMNSPRYRPAGLLVSWPGRRIMFDGGGAAVPAQPVDAWLVTDARAELIADIRRRCRAAGLRPEVGGWAGNPVHVRSLPVAHTSHPTHGYLIGAAGRRVVWAPEFWRFPDWAAGADLMFADAAGWARPIRFAHQVGGHACVLDTADQARRAGRSCCRQRASRGPARTGGPTTPQCQQAERHHHLPDHEVTDFDRQGPVGWANSRISPIIRRRRVRGCRTRRTVTQPRQ